MPHTSPWFLAARPGGRWPTHVSVAGADEPTVVVCAICLTCTSWNCRPGSLLGSCPGCGTFSWRWAQTRPSPSSQHVSSSTRDHVANLSFWPRHCCDCQAAFAASTRPHGWLRCSVMHSAGAAAVHMQAGTQQQQQGKLLTQQTACTRRQFLLHCASAMSHRTPNFHLDCTSYHLPCSGAAGRAAAGEARDRGV